MGWQQREWRLEDALGGHCRDLVVGDEEGEKKVKDVSKG